MAKMSGTKMNFLFFMDQKLILGFGAALTGYF